MTTETTTLVAKAERALAAAKLLFDNGDYDFSASRAYYAMFYIAEAALLTRNQTFSKHAGVIAGFFKAFVTTGQVDKSWHRKLHRAFEDRTLADYDYLDDFPKEEAAKVLADAEGFIQAVEYLCELPTNTP